MSKVVSAVNPHTCGENSTAVYWSAGPNVQSPRPWGKQRLALGATRGRWSIPAPVGKRMGQCRPSGNTLANPHTRGENCITTLAMNSKAGQSPHLWGKHQNEHRCEIYCPRSIPTDAGKSRVRNYKLQVRNYKLQVENYKLKRSPSPHLWGKRYHARKPPTCEKVNPRVCGENLI